MKQGDVKCFLLKIRGIRVKTEPTTAPPNDQNRQNLLEKVRTFWITGVLEKSLHGASLIAPGLEERQDVLANSWHQELQQPNQAAQSLPAGTHITQVYDKAGGKLLILGEPGSGKTTLLLELCRDLLDRAEKENHHPMPVVFYLSPWAVRRQVLADWLVEELHTKYQVPRKQGKVWVANDQIVPLLDGLDEVAQEHRAACIGTINDYQRAHELVPTVVCSRQDEYLTQQMNAQLHSAIIVEPLNPQQIDAYLTGGEERIDALRVALKNDEALQNLATLPLMLSMLTLAYQMGTIEDLSGSPSSETQRQQVFKTYVQQVLSSQSTDTRYTVDQTIRWLSWLAKQLVKQGQTEFYREQIQPGWLPKKRAIWVYRVGVVLIGGLIGGLIVALGAALSGGLGATIGGALAGGLGGGIGGGLFGGGLFGGGPFGGRFAYLQHFILRWLFWSGGCLPWNYVRFLDYATERFLLRKIGSSYIFIHGLLMEYFAALDGVARDVQHAPQPP